MYPNLFRFPEWLPLLGGEYVTSFGVMMLLAFLVAGFVVRHGMERIGEDPEVAWDLLFMAVLGGIGGAKLYYVLLNWPRFMEEGLPFLLGRGGLVWYGGFFLAAALVIWEMRRKRLPIPTMLDITAPALAIAYAVGRVGCFLVGDDWGRPTDAWVGIAFPQGAPPTRVDIIQQQFGIQVDPDLVAQYGQVVPVHPTQLYEVAMSTLIFLVLWRLRFHEHKPGWLFALWLSLAGVERFIVEFFRAKDDRFFGVLTLAQFLSLAIVALGIWGLSRRRRTSEAS